MCLCVLQVAIDDYLERVRKVDFDVFHPSLQRRNPLMPIQLYFRSWKKKYWRFVRGSSPNLYSYVLLATASPNTDSLCCRKYLCRCKTTCVKKKKKVWLYSEFFLQNTLKRNSLQFQMSISNNNRIITYNTVCPVCEMRFDFQHTSFSCKWCSTQKTPKLVHVWEMMYHLYAMKTSFEILTRLCFSFVLLSNVLNKLSERQCNTFLFI